MSFKDPNLATASRMINPSNTANTQDDCPLFKLAAETRNQTYELIFAVEPKEDGSVELDDTTASNALTRTCQQIYNESRKVHELAYHDYPTHTFTIDVPSRQRLLDGEKLDRVQQSEPERTTFIPALTDAFFRQMTSFRVTWRSAGSDITSHFTARKDSEKTDPLDQHWKVRTHFHNRAFLYEREASGSGSGAPLEYYLWGKEAMHKFFLSCSLGSAYPLRDAFASAVTRAICGPKEEDRWMPCFRMKKTGLSSYSKSKRRDTGDGRMNDGLSQYY
jgi:hypothetical protein